ncbi:MAG: hypothetical protein ACFWT6_06680 [Virgibacillus proomii]
MSAWIEISRLFSLGLIRPVALYMSAWIEISFISSSSL